MKSPTHAVYLVLTTFSVLSLARPGTAQQPPQDLVLFKAAMAGASKGFVVAVSPPIVLSEDSCSGQSELLGPFTYQGSSVDHLGVDGRPLYASDGVGVMSAATGDALFITFVALLRPPTPQGVTPLEGAFKITGGRGRFVGAVGSGVITGAGDPVRGTGEFRFDGLISRPREK
jgi:hypothetical protein